MTTRENIETMCEELIEGGHGEYIQLQATLLLADEIDSIHKKLDALLVAHAKLLWEEEGKG